MTMVRDVISRVGPVPFEHSYRKTPSRTSGFAEVVIFGPIR